MKRILRREEEEEEEELSLSLSRVRGDPLGKDKKSDSFLLLCSEMRPRYRHLPCWRTTNYLLRVSVSPLFFFSFSFSYFLRAEFRGESLIFRSNGE